jgi:hypothetical protein
MQQRVPTQNRGDMSKAWFGFCPHCKSALSYLEGVSGSSSKPECPRCHKLVSVSRPTFLVADYSRPANTGDKVH